MTPAHARVRETLKLCRLKKYRHQMGDLLVKMVTEAENEIAAELEKTAVAVIGERDRYKTALEDIAKGMGTLKGGLLAILSREDMIKRAQMEVGKQPDENASSRNTPS